MSSPAASLPLVYACSGCSSAAQLANHLAVRLDREGRAEMSCIAGLGGDVPSLVRVAQGALRRGRAILAIDGCALACVKHTLARHRIEPSRHLELSRHGVRKQMHRDFEADESAALLEQCRGIAAELAAGAAAPVSGTACAAAD